VNPILGEVDHGTLAPFGDVVNKGDESVGVIRGLSVLVELCLDGF